MLGYGDSLSARTLGRWGRVVLPALVISGLSLSVAQADPRVDDETGPALSNAAVPQATEEGGPALTGAGAPHGTEEAAAVPAAEETGPTPADAAPQTSEATVAVATDEAPGQAAEENNPADAAPPPSPEDRVCSAAPVQQQGVASWYGRHWRGRKTASGQRYDERLLTAASRSLPLPTRARVTNLQNGRSVDVIVNDRGPYIDGRIIDLSARAAAVLGITRVGLAPVEITALPQHSAI